MVFDSVLPEKSAQKNLYFFESVSNSVFHHRHTSNGYAHAAFVIDNKL